MNTPRHISKCENRCPTAQSGQHLIEMGQTTGGGAASRCDYQVQGSALAACPALATMPKSMNTAAPARGDSERASTSLAGNSPATSASRPKRADSIGCHDSCPDYLNHLPLNRLSGPPRDSRRIRLAIGAARDHRGAAYRMPAATPEFRTDVGVTAARELMMPSDPPTARKRAPSPAAG